MSLPPSATSVSNSPTASASASVVSGNNMASNRSGTNKDTEPPETRGWLYKRANNIKDYQKRWFVLADGWLRYYSNQAETLSLLAISLNGAHIQTKDSCNFIVSNGEGTRTFHLRASSEVKTIT